MASVAYHGVTYILSTAPSGNVVYNGFSSATGASQIVPNDLVLIFYFTNGSAVPQSFSGTNNAPSLTRAFLQTGNSNCSVACFYGFATSNSSAPSYTGASVGGVAQGIVLMGVIVKPSANRVMRIPTLESQQSVPLAPTNFSVSSVSALNSGDVLFGLGSVTKVISGGSVVQDTDGTWGTLRINSQGSGEGTAQSKVTNGGTVETYNGSINNRDGLVALVSCQEQREDPHWGILA